MGFMCCDLHVSQPFVGGGGINLFVLFYLFLFTIYMPYINRK